MSGSFCGAVLAYIITDTTTSPDFTNTNLWAIFKAILAEIVATFLFVILIHYIVEPANAFTLPYKLASIAGSLYVSRTIASPSTGAALNPSIALGL